MSEEKKPDKTITIKTSDLWKYSTFVLIAILIVGAAFVILGRGSNGSGGAAGAGAAGAGQAAGQGTTGPSLLAAIKNNPDVFPALGPKNAKVTVTEFFDFQCPYCGLASGLVPWGGPYANSSQYGQLYGSSQMAENLAKQGKIRFVGGVMSFLDSRTNASSKESTWAAEAAYCAGNQGKFWQMHDALFAAQTQGEDTGKFDKPKLEILAQNVTGLDQAKFKTCLENDETLSTVQKSEQVASQFAQSTPSFFVNDKQVSASKSAISAAIGSN